MGFRCIPAPMPKPLDVDWELIQTTYTQGVSPAVIAARFGLNASTIRTRASRLGWQRLVTAASQDVAQAASATLKSIGDSLRISLAKQLRDHVAKLPVARGWKHAAQLNQELEPLVRNAKTVIAWSDSGQDGLVRINVIAQNVSLSEEKASFPTTTTPEIEGTKPLSR